MRKTNLFLTTGLLALSLASCGGGPDDGRVREIAPAGGETVATDNGISKLSKAVKATPMQDVWSVKLADTSTLSVSGTTSETYTSESDKANNATNTFDVQVTNPTFEGRFQGLNGAEVANVKASMEMGGDLSITTKQNNDEAIKVEARGASLKTYLDSEYVYVDPRGAKNLFTKAIKAYLGDNGTLLSGMFGSYFDSGYYFEHGLTNEQMPLIDSEATAEVDNYLSLFSDHAEDYKDFLNVSKDGDEYRFYLTLTKADLIRIMNDAQNKYGDETSMNASLDFEDELKDSVVNACEFLVTFTEESITGVSFNIDMEIHETDDITSTDSAGNESVIGVTKADIHYSLKGAVSLGKDAPVIPAETKNYKDGVKELEKLMEIIKSISGSSDSDVSFPF